MTIGGAMNYIPSAARSDRAEPWGNYQPTRAPARTISPPRAAVNEGRGLPPPGGVRFASLGRHPAFPHSYFSLSLSLSLQAFPEKEGPQSYPFIKQPAGSHPQSVRACTPYTWNFAVGPVQPRTAHIMRRSLGTTQSPQLASGV